MVGTFMLANNKKNVNIAGCLWYFGEISLYIKAVYFRHTKKCTSVCGVLLQVMTFQCKHSISESSKYTPLTYVVKGSKILTEY